MDHNGFLSPVEGLKISWLVGWNPPSTIVTLSDDSSDYEECIQTTCDLQIRLSWDVVSLDTGFPPPALQQTICATATKHWYLILRQNHICVANQQPPPQTHSGLDNNIIIAILSSSTSLFYSTLLAQCVRIIHTWFW